MINNLLYSKMSALSPVLMSTVVGESQVKYAVKTSTEQLKPSNSKRRSFNRGNRYKGNELEQNIMSQL